jgi:hypothetical protein
MVGLGPCDAVGPATGVEAAQNDIQRNASRRARSRRLGDVYSRAGEGRAVGLAPWWMFSESMSAADDGEAVVPIVFTDEFVDDLRRRYERRAPFLPK